MRVLSLFDGISCGQVALKRQGFHIDKYYASEIDKYAIQITQKNHSATIQLGDVVALRKMLENDLWILKECVNSFWFDYLSEKRQALYKAAVDLKENGIDLLIGGSPCQGFSFAGKQLNFDDDRSKLFFEFVRIKKILQPKYWLLENVRMKSNVENAISKLLGRKPYRLNSNLVSAQNRFRLYWSNIVLKSVPVDRQIYLKDILQPIDDVDEKYFLSEKALDFITKPMRLQKKFTAINGNKSLCLTAKGNSNWTGTFIQQKSRGFNKGGLFTDKSPTLTSNSWENNNILAMVEVRSDEGKRLRKIARKTKGKDTNPYRAKEMSFRNDGKSNCLMANNTVKDNLVKQQTVFRRLTPIECERLQTLPDDYTKCVSNTQRYKALGNGWTVDIVGFIFSKMQLT